MDSLKMQSPNLVNDNIEKIAALFPNCITEDRDENGTVRRVVDFDLLRQELSASLVEGPRERYTLNWPGKNEAILTANAPIAKTLRPCKEASVDFDNTQNIYIEGDNLDALKLLQETYLNKIKMIYIDPPYNTGNDFIYEDDFADDIDSYKLKTKQIDEKGNKLIDEEKWKQNTTANGRFHSDWLTMMYSRLKLARNLLKDDGVIFISIDNNEVENLKKVCSEIFGEANFISELIWKSGRTAASHFTNEHEYILCFAKLKSSLPLFEYDGDESISDRAIKRPTIKNPVSAIRFPAGIDFQSEDKVFPSIFGEGEPVKIIDGIFEAKNGKLANDVTIEAAWTMKDMIIGWLNGNEIYDQKGQKVTRFFFKANGVLQYEKAKGTVHPKSIIEGYTTKQGGNDVAELLGTNYFSFPKPKDLIASFVAVVTKNDDIVLDFFSGSATTAHAVMAQNSDDDGNRKFIMVQLPEPCAEMSEAFKAGYKTIAEIGKERIRRAGKKIKEENPITAQNLDTGFRVFKVDTSNMKDVYYTPDELKQDNLELFKDHIKPDRSPEDLLFQVFIDWGLDLTLPIAKDTIEGKTVFLVDTNALIACFDSGINEELVKKLAAHKPLRAVFRDDAFGSDSVKINVEQIFKSLSPVTEVKSI